MTGKRKVRVLLLVRMLQDEEVRVNPGLPVGKRGKTNSHETDYDVPVLSRSCCVFAVDSSYSVRYRS